MPTRRQTTGAPAARNAPPRLRLPAARLRQPRHASLQRASDAGRSQDLRSVYRQFVRRLWFTAS